MRDTVLCSYNALLVAVKNTPTPSPYRRITPPYLLYLYLPFLAFVNIGPLSIFLNIHASKPMSTYCLSKWQNSALNNLEMVDIPKIKQNKLCSCLRAVLVRDEGKMVSWIPTLWQLCTENVRESNQPLSPKCKLNRFGLWFL